MAFEVRFCSGLPFGPTVQARRARNGWWVTGGAPTVYAKALAGTLHAVAWFLGGALPVRYKTSSKRMCEEDLDVRKSRIFVYKQCIQILLSCKLNLNVGTVPLGGSVKRQQRTDTRPNLIATLRGRTYPYT